MKNTLLNLIKTCVAVIVLIVLSFNSGLASSNKDKRAIIVASIFPLYDFAKEISGPYARVYLLLPPGASPHCWEPRPSDVALLRQADIIILVGPLEPWAHTVFKAIGCKAHFIIRAAQGANLIKKGVGEKCIDPHVWLDFKWDTVIVKRIESALSRLDPVHRTFYKNRANKLVKSLLELDKEYKRTLKSLKIDYLVIAGHGAFSYFCRAYGIKQIALAGISPDAQPTVLRLARIINFIKQHHIRAFFYEETSSRKPALTIEAETGVKAWPLTPAASLTKKEIENHITFLQLMYRNLCVIKRAFNLHSSSHTSSSSPASSS